MITTYPLDHINYSAAAAQAFHATRTDGVRPGSFSVSSVSDGQLRLAPGLGWMRLSAFAGVTVYDDQPSTVDLGAPDSQQDRVDAVCLRFSATANRTTLAVVKGRPGDLIGPQPTRTSAIRELILYHVRRSAGDPVVSTDDLVDLRSDPRYCGIMLDDLTGVDPTLSKPGYVADAAAVGAELDRKQPLLDDHIVASHPNAADGWGWIKYKSGLAVCWTSAMIRTAINTPWGTGYSGSESFQPMPYPFDFVAAPEEVATASSEVSVMVSRDAPNGRSQSGEYSLYRPDAYPAVGACHLSLIAIGRYK